MCWAAVARAWLLLTAFPGRAAIDIFDAERLRDVGTGFGGDYSGCHHPHYHRNNASRAASSQPPAQRASETEKEEPWYRRHQWVFSITAGHSGSTTLGDLGNYRIPRASDGAPRICGLFEADHQLGDARVCTQRGRGRDAPDAVHPCGVSGWCEGARRAAATAGGIGTGGRGAACALAAEARRYARERLLPVYRKELRECLRSQSPPAAPAPASSTDAAIATRSAGPPPPSAWPPTAIVDLGHHTLFCLGDALVQTLGVERVAFVRIRRARHATVCASCESGVR